MPGRCFVIQLLTGQGLPPGDAELTLGESYAKREGAEPMEMLQSRLKFYTTQGVISTPGKYGVLFDSLPNSVPELVDVVQGLVLHAYWVGHYGVSLTEEQREHASARHMENILAIILNQDAAPLTVPRAHEKRFFGTCRDFSLLLTSALRHKGIPARCRCGFARYFMPDSYEDHWIVEYWDEKEGNWVGVDAQLDGLQREKLHISFDPLRLPEGQFVSGAEAWKLWRAGEVDPNKFGIADLRGYPFIFGNLIRDLAALNKMELLPWDLWGLMKKDKLEESDYILADKIADLILADSEELFDLYESNEDLKASECPVELRLYSGEDN